MSDIILEPVLCCQESNEFTGGNAMRNPVDGSGASYRMTRKAREWSGPAVRIRTGRGAAGIAAAFAAVALAVGWGLQTLPAAAMEFRSGELRGSIDTTISHGLSVRVENPDARLAASANKNDGNLNYRRGIISNTSKITTDLSLEMGEFATFARVSGFYDMENYDGERARSPLSSDARSAVGRDLELLDLYGSWSGYVGDTALDLRLGQHVLNWGESTYIQNGINVINPFDVSKLRLPGSELREGLLPVNMASVTVAPTDTLSFEGFYQLDWESTKIDPRGTYFSSTDYVGAGAESVVIELPGVNISDDGLGPQSRLGFEPLVGLINADLAGQPPLAFPDPDFLSVRRGADINPGNEGQYGLAVRLLSEDLNDTEFGGYFVRYHNRLPIVGAQSSPLASIQAGLGAAQAVSSPTSRTLGAIAQAVTQQVMAGVQAGQIPPAAAGQIIQEQVAAQVQGIASALAVDRYAKGSQYYIHYPKDQTLFGLSLSTQIGASGWALQGEFSFRPDAPLQKAERSILEEGLSPVITALGLASVNPAGLGQYLAGYQPFTIDGYVKRDVSQWQATVTKSFGPVMGSDGVIFLAEAAVMHVHNMPDDAVTPIESGAGSTEDDYQDADATSLGYRLAARLDYNSAVGALNLFPYGQFQHDVKGNSPSPIGPFAEGRMGLTLGIKADYLSQWEFDFGVSFLWGETNELKDRDFIYSSIKYSF